MARTSKTIYNRGAGEAEDRKIRASEIGRAGVREKERQLNELAERELAQGRELGAQVGQSMQRHQEFTKSQEQQKEIETGRQALDQQQIDLRASEQGKMRAPGAPTSPLLDERQARLQSEMEQAEKEGQNRQAQAKKPMEMGTGAGRSFIDSPEGEAAKANEVDRAAYRDETDRIKAEAYRAQVVGSYRQAKLKGDVEEAARRASELEKPIKDEGERFNRFMQGKDSDEDWAALKRVADKYERGIEGGGGVSISDLTEDITAKRWTPRVQAFLNAQIGYEGMKYIAETGRLPLMDHFDFNSKVMEDFRGAAEYATGWMKTFSSVGNWIGIKSISGKNEFMNKMAAGMVMSGMYSRMKNRSAGQAGMPPPSAGGQPSAGGPPSSPPEPQQDEASNMPPFNPPGGTRGSRGRAYGKPKSTWTAPQ